MQIGANMLSSTSQLLSATGRSKELATAHMTFLQLFAAALTASLEMSMPQISAFGRDSFRREV